MHMLGGIIDEKSMLVISTPAAGGDGDRSAKAIVQAFVTRPGHISSSPR